LNTPDSEGFHVLLTDNGTVGLFYDTTDTWLARC